MAKVFFEFPAYALRMMTKEQAAVYCGRPVKVFERECPVSPIAFPNNDRRWDVHDLDEWLDSIKTVHGNHTHDSILGSFLSDDRPNQRV